MPKRCLGLTNKIGWWTLGSHWPLITTHVFVLRKVSEVDDSVRADFPAAPNLAA